MRSLGRGEPGQDILHVSEGIDLEALACFDDAHYCSGSLTALFGAGKEPITPAEHHRFDAPFTGVVGNVDKGMIQGKPEERASD